MNGIRSDLFVGINKNRVPLSDHGMAKQVPIHSDKLITLPPFII